MGHFLVGGVMAQWAGRKRRTCRCHRGRATRSPGRPSGRRSLSRPRHRPRGGRRGSVRTHRRGGQSRRGSGVCGARHALAAGQGRPVEVGPQGLECARVDIRAAPAQLYGWLPRGQQEPLRHNGAGCGGQRCRGRGPRRPRPLPGWGRGTARQGYVTHSRTRFWSCEATVPKGGLPDGWGRQVACRSPAGPDLHHSDERL